MIPSGGGLQEAFVIRLIAGDTLHFLTPFLFSALKMRTRQKGVQPLHLHIGV
jgi:hypothetical protein